MEFFWAIHLFWLWVPSVLGFLAEPHYEIQYIKTLIRSASSDAEQYWGDDDVGVEEVISASPSLFALHPESDRAREMVEDLGLADYYSQLVELTHLILDWNDRVNLVSRKDCRLETIWGRHVWPSLAGSNFLGEAQSVVDVGTGGGFPGLPLSICNPSVNFMLVDSVGKKINAVQDMAKQLGLDNVQTHHGRAELLDQKYDLVTGRSVTNLPQFCTWIQHFQSPLLYWIGGELDANIQGRVDKEYPIEESEKRIVNFSAASVQAIARESGLVVMKPNPTKKKKQQRQTNKAKGSWSKERNTPKNRGYENFQRYSS